MARLHFRYDTTYQLLLDIAYFFVINDKYPDERYLFKNNSIKYIFRM